MKKSMLFAGALLLIGSGCQTSTNKKQLKMTIVPGHHYYADYDFFERKPYDTLTGDAIQPPCIEEVEKNDTVVYIRIHTDHTNPPTTVAVPLRDGVTITEEIGKGESIHYYRTRNDTLILYSYGSYIHSPGYFGTDSIFWDADTIQPEGISYITRDQQLSISLFPQDYYDEKYKEVSARLMPKTSVLPFSIRPDLSKGFDFYKHNLLITRYVKETDSTSFYQEYYQPEAPDQKGTKRYDGYPEPFRHWRRHLEITIN